MFVTAPKLLFEGRSVSRPVTPERNYRYKSRIMLFDATHAYARRLSHCQRRCSRTRVALLFANDATKVRAAPIPSNGTNDAAHELVRAAPIFLTAPTTPRTYTRPSSLLQRRYALTHSSARLFQRRQRRCTRTRMLVSSITSNYAAQVRRSPISYNRANDAAHVIALSVNPWGI
jgi:hypothetical protein